MPRSKIESVALAAIHTSLPSLLEGHLDAGEPQVHIEGYWECKAKYTEKQTTFFVLYAVNVNECF